MLRVPRRRASRRGRVSPPEMPRHPCRSAAQTADQVSPGAPSTGPLSSLGQRLVRVRWASAREPCVPPSG
jgi:hypothetical protein